MHDAQAFIIPPSLHKLAATKPFSSWYRSKNICPVTTKKRHIPITASSLDADIIKYVKAREIFDNRGYPALEIEIITGSGSFFGVTPNALTPGNHEFPLRFDQDSTRYNGKGLQRAASIVYARFFEPLKGVSVLDQREFDALLHKIDESQDLSSNTSVFAANTIFATSLAAASAAATAKNVPLFYHIAQTYASFNSTNSVPPHNDRDSSLSDDDQKDLHNKENQVLKNILPVPAIAMIQGGSLVQKGIPFQEIFIMPTGTYNVREAMRMSVEIFRKLEKVVVKKFGTQYLFPAENGAFALPMDDLDDAFNLIEDVIADCEYLSQVKIGIDVDANALYQSQGGLYNLEHPKSKQPDIRDIDSVVSKYNQWSSQHKISTIIDPFSDDDWDAWKKLNSTRKATQIVAGNLIAGNPNRMQKAIATSAANAVRIKPSQAGTLSRAIQTAHMAHQAGWATIASARNSGFEYPWITDFAVGIGSGVVRVGAPRGANRTAEFNRLLRIEEHLGGLGRYAGNKFSQS